MAHIYFTAGGKAWRREPGATTLTELTVPGSVSVKSPAIKPCLIRYRGRIFNVGQYSRPVVLDELGAFRPAGVTAPTDVPVLADGADSGGSTGLAIAYQTFLVKSGTTVIAESNPGPSSNTLDMAGTGRSTSGLDTTPTEASVTHTRLYISVDGSIPALAYERSISGFTGTITENVLTGALGETLPVRLGLDGAVELDGNSRGIPPYTQFVELYHERFYYAGDPDHPERIYPSKLYEPEGVNTTTVTVNGVTQVPWLSTTDGQPVTGIKRAGDELIIGKPRGIDIVQDYQGEYTIRASSAYWGVISHFSMRVCGPNGSLWFAAPQGPTIYNAGSYRYVGGPLENWWRDNYRLYPSYFEQCYGASDRFWRNYRLQIPWYDGGTVYLNGDYHAAELGEPIWVRDYRSRLDTCQIELEVTSAQKYFDLYVGSSDGYTRLENVMTDANDDGDTYAKKLTLQTPHRFMGDQSGDDAQGSVYNGLDVFLKHSDQPATLSLYAGDDAATEAAAPQWTRVSPATAAATGERALTARTSEHHAVDNVSGKGVSLKIEVTAPVGVEFRGWGVDHVEIGPQARPYK